MVSSVDMMLFHLGLGPTHLPRVLIFVFYERRELNESHEGLGHVNARSEASFLRPGNPNVEDSNDDRELLKEILESCLICEKSCRGPRRMRTTRPFENVSSRAGTVDFMFIVNLSLCYRLCVGERS